MLYVLLMVAAQILICAFMESSKWRGTPGKLIMKLQITDNAGNPISFGKALIRIIAYSYSKKFFHDQLSNTVIGERLP